MPLIPYPDVPPLSGVPPVPRSSLVPTPTVGTTQPTSLPQNATGTQWGFVDSSGTSVIVPDSFIDFEYREERKIPIYPIEGGSFQSYNKVSLPFDVKVTVSCNGNGKTKKNEFLNSIQELMDNLTLVDVITPDYLYSSCNLIHADYRRESTRGVSLIIAQLWFQQVNIVQESAPETTEPSGATTQNNGQVSTVPPTTQQKVQITNAASSNMGLKGFQ
jgi:hypothetical protein